MPTADRLTGRVADSARPFALVGDVGGTNCRLALVRRGGRPGDFHAPLTMACADHPSFDEALAFYLDHAGVDVGSDVGGAAATGGRGAIGRAVVAVAGPVIDGAVQMTNHPWSITEAQLSAWSGGGPARLVNDYAALAYAAPAMTASDLRPLGPSPGFRPHGSIAVLGAGTGFGVSALVRDGEREAALVGEGGHVAFAPQDRLEIEIQRFLGLRFGRVSIERILSGPGLLNLHQAISHIEGRPAAFLSPAEVTDAAAAGDAHALLCAERFCAILGAVAGDFALSYGARGGVQIAGGVSQRLLATPARGAFRARFDDKGRFTTYVAAIPTDVLAHPHAALVGAARALDALPP